MYNLELVNKVNNIRIEKKIENAEMTELVMILNEAFVQILDAAKPNCDNSTHAMALVESLISTGKCFSNGIFIYLNSHF